MLSRGEVVAWVAVRYGPKHAEKRTRDGGFAYWIDTQPDYWMDQQPDASHDGDGDAMPHGAGACVVVKRTGDVWFLGSNPESLPVYRARSERQLRRRLRTAGHNPDIPDEIVGENPAHLPEPMAHKVEHDQLVRWLESFGWREPACEITDRVFAFVVVPKRIPHHNGPIFVIKRTAGVWHIGTSPETRTRAYAARSEYEFYAALHSVAPTLDPRLPHDRVSPRFANPLR
jgi:hypothetical protein